MHFLKNQTIYLFGSSFLEGLIILNCLLSYLVDWSGRRRRLLREYGAGETPQKRSAEEATRHACGKRSRIERKSTGPLENLTDWNIF